MQNVFHGRPFRLSGPYRGGLSTQVKFGKFAKTENTSDRKMQIRK
ncbi:hypothetical protein Ga0080574_TMP1349 [Salipiger abyssi]|uniref:Uncharacterized protein n=1 Tax=Salipiger abyssi TaxID=1250539 RepID=A0A1P8UQL0_9RHOB|nr:hypothetical protein Ga0080574_TMP1349 [Salipiger abyssi]